MEPPEAFQLGVPKRLDTETHPVDASVAKPVHPLDARRLGIGLEGDFGAGFDPECLPAGLDQSANLRRLEERRRTATEIHGVD